MKCIAMLLALILFSGITIVSAQNNAPPADAALQNISSDISKISKSLDELNKKLKTFTDTFNSNQGIRLSDKQQKLLFAFEMLNRAETRLSTLQLLKVQLADREATTKRKIAQVDDNMRAEVIDRTLGGTTNAELVRTSRRTAFQTKKNDLSKLLADIQDSLSDTNAEIQQTELFLRQIRRRIFSEAQTEITEL